MVEPLSGNWPNLDDTLSELEKLQFVNKYANQYLEQNGNCVNYFSACHKVQGKEFMKLG